MGTRLRAAKLRTAKHCKSVAKSSIPRIPKGNPHEASGRPASPKHSVSGIRLDTLGECVSWDCADSVRIQKSICLVWRAGLIVITKRYVAPHRIRVDL